MPPAFIDLEAVYAKNKEYFPHESAWHLLTKKIPVVFETTTIADVEQLLVDHMKEFETINYIYVVKDDMALSGIVSVKDIFRSPKHIGVLGVMKKDIISVRPHTDQEHVALLALKHNLKAVPVVDKENRLLGVVPSDMILRILHNESVEDALRFAGVHKFKDPARSIIDASTFLYLKKRLPWLVLGLFGGVGAAFVIDLFETALKAELLLAAFIPVVVYIADAVGTQTQTLYIRSFAIDKQMPVVPYLWRELKVTLLLAIILGVLIGVVLFIVWDAFILGIILGVSFFATILMAAIVGILLSWGAERFSFDPAIASGPFATIVCDVLSLLIYFSIAQTTLLFVKPSL